MFLASVLERVSSICLGKGCAPWRCTCTVETPFWLWMVYGCCALMGRAHLTDSMVLSRICSSVLWPEYGKHLTSGLVLHFFAAARMKESISQALCSCTCLRKLQREPHLRIIQCVFHIRASQPLPMWNVHSIHSSWNVSLLCLALDLDFWLSFGLSFGLLFWATAKKQEVHVLTY